MKMMRVVAVLFVLVLMTSGCSMLGNSAKITVKNKPAHNVKMTDVVKELNANYGEADVKYRAYKLPDGTTQIVKDLYYDVGDGTVIVTTINEEVTEILTVGRKDIID